MISANDVLQPMPPRVRGGIGSEPEFERELCEPRYSVSPFLMLGPFPPSPPFRVTRPPEVSEAREARGQPDPTVER